MQIIIQSIKIYLFLGSSINTKNDNIKQSNPKLPFNLNKVTNFKYGQAIKKNIQNSKTNVKIYFIFQTAIRLV